MGFETRRLIWWAGYMAGFTTGYWRGEQEARAEQLVDGVKKWDSKEDGRARGPGIQAREGRSPLKGH